MDLCKEIKKVTDLFEKHFLTLYMYMDAHGPLRVALLPKCDVSCPTYLPPFGCVVCRYNQYWIVVRIGFISQIWLKRLEMEFRFQFDPDRKVLRQPEMWPMFRLRNEKTKVIWETGCETMRQSWNPISVHIFDARCRRCRRCRVRQRPRPKARQRRKRKMRRLKRRNVKKLRHRRSLG